MLVLGDDHLERLRCSRCHKYLSVYPVKNHRSREVTCGRCSGTDADENGSVRSTLYELVAGEYLFRCVNRYEGCRKLLRADETEAHEQECVGKVFRCPKCEDGVDRSVLELISHYMSRHPSSHLKKNSIQGVLLKRDVMLYVQDDVVFFIFIQRTPTLNDLRLSAVTLTEANVTQAFFIGSGSLFTRSEKKPCASLNASNEYHFDIPLSSLESLEVVFNLEVSKGDRLYDVSVSIARTATTAVPVDHIESIASISERKNFELRLEEEPKTKLRYKWNDSGTALSLENGQEIDLACSNCKQLITLPMYRCEKSHHKICHTCRAWCGICDCSVADSGEDPLKRLVPLLESPCRWKCGGYFTTDLRTHEKSCKLKILKCPMCSFEISAMTLMKIHLLDNHQIPNFCEDFDVKQIQSFIEKYKKGQLSFLFHDKCLYLKWSYSRTINGYNYHILNFGLFKDEPNIKLDLVHNNGLICASLSQELHISQLPIYLPYINFNPKIKITFNRSFACDNNVADRAEPRVPAARVQDINLPPLLIRIFDTIALILKF